MSRLVIDELWLCLCPSWNATIPLKATGRLQRARQTSRCLKTPIRRSYSAQTQLNDEKSRNWKPFEAGQSHRSSAYISSDRRSTRAYTGQHTAWNREEETTPEAPAIDLSSEPTRSLYSRMKSSAAKGDYDEVRLIVEYLVRERREKPNLEHYNALILSNISARPGAAWRAHDLFVEMQQIGLQPDNATCHAVLKVLAVHPDHLFRSDLLEYMRLKWFGVNEDGEHDIMAGLLREGQFEQALERLENMVSRNMSAHGWLLDMFVYMLCEAEEVGEAYKIMNARHLNGELNMSRTLWHYFLDKASALHHQEATTLAWKSQVNLEFLNPSSGICLNVLTTASRAGDPTLATAVFAHLSKRGEVFKPLHYQLLIDAYLSASTLDPNRALSILALMPAEKIQPTSWQTRSLFKHLRNDPDLIHSSFAHIKVLHSDGRAIPIAAFNVLIESWAHMKNLPEALKIYKQIHTFRSSDAAPLANAETFNHLLKCCRTAKPPDEAQASFLIGEMLALRIKPNALTYDRLILVFITTAQHHMHLAESAADQADAEKSTARARMLLDWANRHFLDMQPLNWMPRFGTLEMLATQLARLRDSRCWDVLQMAEDAGADKIEGWDEKGKWAWKNVENAWDAAGGEERNVEEQGAVSDDETGGVAMAQLLG